MFKRLKVFGLILVAATAAVVHPAAAFGYERGQGDAFHGRYGYRRFAADRDFRQNHEWRERDAREHARREREWREREPWANRGYYNRYNPGYYSNPYSHPY